MKLSGAGGTVSAGATGAGGFVVLMGQQEMVQMELMLGDSWMIMLVIVLVGS